MSVTTHDTSFRLKAAIQRALVAESRPGTVRSTYGSSSIARPLAAGAMAAPLQFGQPLGQDDVVLREFDVQVGNAGAPFLDDRCTIEEVADRHENAFGVDGMVR